MQRSGRKAVVPLGDGSAHSSFIIVRYIKNIFALNDTCHRFSEWGNTQYPSWAEKMSIGDFYKPKLLAPCYQIYLLYRQYSYMLCSVGQINVARSFVKRSVFPKGVMY